MKRIQTSSRAKPTPSRQSEAVDVRRRTVAAVELRRPARLRQRQRLQRRNARLRNKRRRLLRKSHPLRRGCAVTSSRARARRTKKQRSAVTATSRKRTRVSRGATLTTTSRSSRRRSRRAFSRNVTSIKTYRKRSLFVRIRHFPGLMIKRATNNMTRTT